SYKGKTRRRIHMRGLPPVFKRKIQDLEANVGSSAKFECETEDAPDVTFKWFKSDSEIRQSDKYRIISRYTTSSLELLTSTKADGGEYTCLASNRHGSDSCSANLNITGKLNGFLLFKALHASNRWYSHVQFRYHCCRETLICKGFGHIKCSCGHLECVVDNCEYCLKMANNHTIQWIINTQK
uniref:Ig-like domain-containing protein n=1 Tax=Pygocentrus nattereri TaxID=42514 RepID=A0AAR2LNV2_PYGNA